jgi:hydroxymethylglutaryl-CoA reductase
LRILSNLTDRRLAKATAVLTPAALERPDMSGEEVIQGMLHAYAFAAVDPYRATTHNKAF